jgi:NAD(P)-dependent dehydrogenase (short-subunit alcohol dehydrogenase family)
MPGIDGKVVVITGASAGVGRAVARAYGRRKARVAVIARGEAGLKAVADEIRDCGGEPLELALDVADADAVFAAGHRVEDELGPIDVWINNACTSVYAPVAEISSAEFRRVTEVSYLGCVYGTMAALQLMRPRNHGVIVQVGSALAYRGIPLQSAYCGAKHAIQGFTESLRTELLHDRSGVRVTMVQLPALNTPQFSWVRSRLPVKSQPVPPIYEPELAAQAILFAADHPQRREYWVGSSTAATLVANAVAPGLLDRYLAHAGFDAQQPDQARSRTEPNNLWHPVDGQGGHDFGAHGTFDDRAAHTDPQLWFSQHHAAIALTGAALARATLKHRRRHRKTRRA